MTGVLATTFYATHLELYVHNPPCFRTLANGGFLASDRPPHMGLHGVLRGPRLIWCAYIEPSYYQILN